MADYTDAKRIDCPYTLPKKKHLWYPVRDILRTSKLFHHFGTTALYNNSTIEIAESPSDGWVHPVNPLYEWFMRRTAVVDKDLSIQKRRRLELVRRIHFVLYRWSFNGYRKYNSYNARTVYQLSREPLRLDNVTFDISERTASLIEAIGHLVAVAWLLPDKKFLAEKKRGKTGMQPSGDETAEEVGSMEAVVWHRSTMDGRPTWIATKPASGDANGVRIEQICLRAYMSEGVKCTGAEMELIMRLVFKERFKRLLRFEWVGWTEWWTERHQTAYDEGKMWEGAWTMEDVGYMLNIREP